MRRFYCPACGTAREGRAGDRLTCEKCGSAFDAPFPDADVGAAVDPSPAPVVTSARPKEKSASFGGSAPLTAAAPRSAPQGQTSTAAILSFVFGLLWCVPVVAPVVALLAGFVALANIDERGEKGKGFAIAGIILGSLAALITVLIAINFN